jgi:hypothetical protein
VFVFLDSEEIIKFQSNCGRQSEGYRKGELKIKENMCRIYPQLGRQAPDPGGGMEHLVIDRTHLPLVWSSAALEDMLMLELISRT